MKPYNFVLIALYAVCITALGVIDYRISYWPSLVFAILLLCFITLSSKPNIAQVALYCLGICAVIGVSELIVGVYNAPTREISIDEFIESEFWASIYFYIPIIITTLSFFYINKLLERFENR